MQNDSSYSSSQQKFLRRLSANMHELAQPLSIIQASLELALLSPITVEQHRDVASGALRELQRAVECMQFGASLTRFQQPAQEMQEVSLGAVLESVISDLCGTLEAAQVQVLFRRSAGGPSLRFSPTRLRQMFFYMLQAAQGCSRPGDIVRVEIQEMAGHVVIWMEHSWRSHESESCSDAVPATNRTVEKALDLAEAIISSAGGKFSATASPFLTVADFVFAESGSVLDSNLEKNERSAAVRPIAVNSR